MKQHDYLYCPDYRIITLRDRECDAGSGIDEALDRARRDVAASTGYELVILCEQDELPVSTTVRMWEKEPSLEDGVLRFELECPTGELVLGSPTGEAYALGLPAGPGRYAVAVTYSGREEARDRAQQYIRRLDDEDIDELVESWAGTERYQVHLWRTGDFFDEEEDEEEPDRSVAVGQGTILARYHLFYLADLHDHDLSVRTDHSNGLAMAQDGLVQVFTGRHTGMMRLRTEAHVRAPDTDLDRWEDVVEVSMYAPVGRVAPDSVDGGADEGFPVLTRQGPGHYRFRIHVRGRDAGVEHYLVQCWPQEPGPVTELKLTDRYGAALRTAR
ncbi:hypothetical protein D5S17_17465 [Pseudonocardiaceae bacterium YIM PH 21723]|nr:hypothetical protein D5S17_17465 [Pseudonocardiaceae bacterium YIM PH 21723]